MRKKVINNFCFTETNFQVLTYLTNARLFLDLAGQLSGFLLDFDDVSDHVEGSLGQVVEFSVQDLVESLDGVLERTSFPGVPVKVSATWKGCERKRWIFLALCTVNFSSWDNSPIPKMAMISWSDLKSCKIFLTLLAQS